MKRIVVFNNKGTQIGAIHLNEDVAELIESDLPEMKLEYQIKKGKSKIDGLKLIIHKTDKN